MEKESFDKLKRNISDPLWRLNNLYHIIDENGMDTIFSMRPAQRQFYDNLWYFNVILKARQLGFTTLIDLMGLDMAVTTPNMTCKIIAETKSKAADIFDAKIIYPYEHLPEELRKWTSVVRCSKDGEIVFSNGSSIKVSVSARSGTCQFLHISEYGPVCATQPAKANEILTGSIPSVHSGGWCFIESTAMGNSGHFYDLVQRAKASMLSKRKLEKLEFRLHFFPWHENAEYHADPEIVSIPSRLLDYFDELYSKYGIEVNEEQQAWYAMQESIYQDKIWSEYPSYSDEAFKVANDGAYYGRQFADIYRQNRICNVPYDESIPVYTGWDLGMSDETSIWFFQFYGKEIRVIDFYSNNGEGLPFYVNVLRDKGYRYGKHFAPHDIAVRELSTGASRMDVASSLGLDFVRVMTNKDLMAGIDNVREILQYCWFDDSKTESGRKCLESYRKEWDDAHGCFRSQPLHDWSSHAADAFRTIAQAWKQGLISAAIAGNKPIRITGGLKKI